MSCAQIAVCAYAQVPEKWLFQAFRRGISEKSASGVFLKQAFFAILNC